MKQINEAMMIAKKPIENSLKDMTENVIVIVCVTNVIEIIKYKLRDIFDMTDY